jgi:hypothetical protein
MAIANVTLETDELLCMVPPVYGPSIRNGPEGWHGATTRHRLPNHGQSRSTL